MKALLYGLVALLNVVHPFIHGFEAGGLDAVLIQLDGFIMAVDPYLPAVRR